MADPVSIFLAVDAGGNSLAKIYGSVSTRLPHARLEKWRKAALLISREALDHREAIPKNQMPKYISRYSQFRASLSALEECFNEAGHAIQSFRRRMALTRTLEKQGQAITKLAMTAHTTGSNDLFLCQVHHPQREDGGPCSLCNPDSVKASAMPILTTATASSSRTKVALDDTAVCLNLDVNAPTEKLQMVSKRAEIGGYGELLITEEYV
ncbi:hypothetical protein B0H16DRAFT_1531250 [Mycena metata]|uniref:Uncharacterized protein n=1 Tax=Mycena metata TaxID=1033252 RepID=A0AAD7JB58_9AGAR|nr:hypothetical protein B0H16DRAFT_1531250 [Mycena metata]